MRNDIYNSPRWPFSPNFFNGKQIVPLFYQRSDKGHIQVVMGVHEDGQDFMSSVRLANPREVEEFYELEAQEKNNGTINTD